MENQIYAYHAEMCKVIQGRTSELEGVLMTILNNVNVGRLEVK